VIGCEADRVVEHDGWEIIVKSWGEFWRMRSAKEV
jgi:hypothetical protein